MVGTHGYGILSVGSKKQQRKVLVHQVALVLSGKGFDPSLDVDHACNLKRCFEPTHIRQITHRENSLRGGGPFAANASKLCCKHGHEFNERNTLVYVYK